MFEIFSKHSHYMALPPFSFCIASAVEKYQEKYQSLACAQLKSSTYVVIQKLEKHSQKVTVSK